MGLFQQAVETYDCNASRVGVYHEGEREPLAPICHIIAKATVEITIDQNGKFLSASPVDKEHEKTIVPVTGASAGRTSTSAHEHPHPLCDQLKYLTAEKNHYIPQLEAWAASAYSTPKLQAILTYVKKQNLRQDLAHLKAKEDSFVRWRVVGLGSSSGPCWEDWELFRSHIAYQAEKQDNEKVLCMVTGEYSAATQQHMKGIVALYGNAKLISFKDDNAPFKYKGRFTDASQAVTVSYIASQKAHNALRWLIANQGTQAVFGGRTFLCWNPQGIRTGSPVQSFFQDASVIQTKPSDYKNQLAATLTSRRKELQLRGNETAVIAVFDAATPGRLSMTYYNEISVSSFLERICTWDEHCCWWNGKYGIQPPSLITLVKNAFGTQRGGKGTASMEADDKVLRQELETLLACRLSKNLFPEHIRAALVQRAGTPQAYEPKIWRGILYSACAAIQMTTYQRKGEEIMSWELDKPERSFQFGRLLAVMERAEDDYYILTGETGRQTNAMKRMSVFRQRPWTVFEQINTQLNTAYLPRIKPWQRKRYQRLTGEIVTILSSFLESELRKPLGDLYLMGYELQRNTFFTNNKNHDMEENQNEQA